MGTYFLFENATGYYLFLKKESEDFGIKLKHVQQSILESKRFRKMIKLVGHLAFETAAQALENIAEISTGSFTETAAEFLQTSIPKLRKAKLAVEDARLPSSISEFLPKLKCEKNEVTDEIFRGIRLHFLKLISGIEHRDLSKAQLGLAHAFSRNKVAHDVNRADKPIIQAIALIDQLDKDINTFAMRIKEWYSWHFPELKAIVTDNILYARTVSFIKNKESLEGDIMEELTELVESEEIAQQIIDASKISMGQEFSDIDYAQIGLFTNQAVSLADYRKHIADYLKDRMDNVAPNLAALIGEVVGARLISQAGGLVNLAKYPSSTLQILGAEKALFRALKTRGNTPKYGIIYHSSFIGKAGQKNKGRISRFLANKCSIASRIDSFFPSITNAFGEKMREQVEERLEYFDTGERGAPNDEVMEEVLKSLKPKKKRKHSSQELYQQMDDERTLPFSPTHRLMVYQHQKYHANVISTARALVDSSSPKKLSPRSFTNSYAMPVRRKLEIDTENERLLQSLMRIQNQDRYKKSNSHKLCKSVKKEFDAKMKLENENLRLVNRLSNMQPQVPSKTECDDFMKKHNSRVCFIQHFDSNSNLQRDVLKRKLKPINLETLQSIKKLVNKKSPRARKRKQLNKTLTTQ